LTYRGSSSTPTNQRPTEEHSARGIFGENPNSNPGFWDAHKVYVPYLSGDLFLGTRIEPYTFPPDPDWGTRDNEPTNAPQPEFYFSGHLHLEHIVTELSTNATFTETGGGLDNATDVLLTGCSAGGYGVRYNADWLLDTLPAGANVRAAPAAALGYKPDTAWLNAQAGVEGGFPIMLPRPDGVPDGPTLWSRYANPASLAACLDSVEDRTEDEAQTFCISNLGQIASLRTPTMFLTNQFDTRPIMFQYANESDFAESDTSTLAGQQYLAYWGTETRRFLIDHVQYAFAPSCFDHCNLTPLSRGPSVDGAQALDIINDWFHGHNMISHKMIEGVGTDGVDRHPNNGLPSNPDCLLSDNLLGDNVTSASPTPASTLPPPPLPPQCDTQVEQQGTLCQQVCNCDCSAGGQGGCQTVCQLPNGAQSLPWCQGGGAPTIPDNNPPPPSPTADTDIVVETSVTYMTAFGQDFVLDIYSDANVDTDQPLMIVVHGGGFVGGDKANEEYFARLFAERGFRVVNINYPLCRHFFDHSTEALHPWDAAQPTNGDNSLCVGVASGTDNLPEEIRGSLAGPASRAVRQAIKYMHTDGRAAQYRVDTSKTVCHGSSAGATTCYVTLFWNTTLVSYPNITNALVPDPDLDQYNINVAAAKAGSIGGLMSGQYVTQDTVDAMAPGAAIWDLHGDADTTVPIAFSNYMMQIAEQWGIPNDQVVIEGGGHGMARFLRGSVLEDMLTFVFANLENAGGYPASDTPTPTPTTLLTVTELTTSGGTFSPTPSSVQVATPSPTPSPTPSRTPSPTPSLTSSLTSSPTSPPTDLPTSPGQDASSSSGGDGDGDHESSTIILVAVIALVVVAIMVIGMVMYQRRHPGAEHDTEASENPAYHPRANQGSVRSLVLDSTGGFRPGMASGPSNGMAEHTI
jgi:hypothetical protein